MDVSSSNLHNVTINDLAEKLDVSPSTLRAWQEKLEIEVPKNNKGHRRYTLELVKIFTEVRKLLADNKSFDEIKNIINTEDITYTETYNETYIHPKVEVFNEEKDPDQQKADMILYPYKTQIDRANNRIDELLDRIDKLQTEKYDIKEQALMQKAKLAEDYLERESKLKAELEFLKLQLEEKNKKKSFFNLFKSNKI
jgi:DNA-binding transcriptional MerR regulator